MNPFVILSGLFFLVSIAKALVRVPENHRGAIERLGRFEKSLNPGLHVIIPFADRVKMIDLDTSLPGWQGMTDGQISVAIENLVKYGTARPAVTVTGNRPFFVPGAKEEQTLSTWLIKTASAQIGVDLSHDPLARSRLIESARTACEQLATRKSIDINLPFLTAGASGPKHFSYTLTQAQFDEILGKNQG